MKNRLNTIFLFAHIPLIFQIISSNSHIYFDRSLWMYLILSWKMAENTSFIQSVVQTKTDLLKSSEDTLTSITSGRQNSNRNNGCSHDIWKLMLKYFSFLEQFWSSVGLAASFLPFPLRKSWYKRNNPCIGISFNTFYFW